MRRRHHIHTSLGHEQRALQGLSDPGGELCVQLVDKRELHSGRIRRRHGKSVRLSATTWCSSFHSTLDQISHAELCVFVVVAQRQLQLGQCLQARVVRSPSTSTQTKQSFNHIRRLRRHKHIRHEKYAECSQRVDQQRASVCCRMSSNK